jgi:hypothetical protein
MSQCATGEVANAMLSLPPLGSAFAPLSRFFAALQTPGLAIKDYWVRLLG